MGQVDQSHGWQLANVWRVLAAVVLMVAVTTEPAFACVGAGSCEVRYYEVYTLNQSNVHDLKLALLYVGIGIFGSALSSKKTSFALLAVTAYVVSYNTVRAVFPDGCCYSPVRHSLLTTYENALLFGVAVLLCAQIWSVFRRLRDSRDETPAQT
jgi:hypothetical protein